MFPKAANCPNGDALPLFVLPLIRNPSAARWLSSLVAAGAESAERSGALAVAFRSVR